MHEVVAVIVAGVVTFATRVAFLLDRRFRPPKRAARYLPLIGPAVLAAIAVPGIVAPRGEISWVDSVPAIVAAVVSWVLWQASGRRMWIGLVGGLATWWGVLALLSWFGLPY